MNKKHSIFMIVLTLLLAIFTPVNQANASQEPEINQNETSQEPTLGELITSFQILKSDGSVVSQDNPLKPTESFEVEFSWKIPSDRQVVKGNKYSENLGDAFKFLELPWTVGTELLDASGSSYGSFEITPEGELSLVFSDDFAGNDNTYGKFRFSTSFNKEEVEKITKLDELVFKIGSKEMGQPVFIERDGTSLSKSGLASGKGAKFVEWTVDVNKNLAKLNQAVLTESFDPLLTFESVKVYGVDVNIYGEVIVGSEIEISSDKYTITADGTVLNLGTIDQAYRVVYTTTVNSPSELEGTVQFNNTISLKDGALELTATADASSVYEGLVNKSASYNADKQEINWLVDYNFNGASISQENAKISDAILVDANGNKNAYFVKDSFVVYEIEFDPQTQEILTRTKIDATKYTLTVDENGAYSFDLQFKEAINKAYQIEYTTKNSVQISEDIVVKNEVTSNGKTDKAQETMSQQIVVKSSPKVNYRDMNIEWQVVINRTGQEKLLDFSLGDTYSDGLTLDKDSIVIKNSKGDRLVEGIDYKVYYPLEVDYVPSGNTYKDTYLKSVKLRIDFIGDYKEINEKITVDYKTDIIDNSAVDLKNNAVGHFKYGIGTYPKPGEPGGPGGSIGGGGPTVDDGGYVTVGNLKPVPETPEITNNASKSGSYNPVTKRITWTVNLNYVRQPLVGATFKDILQGIVVDGKTVATQTYVPGSLKLHYFSIQNSVPLQIEIGKALEKDVDYQVLKEFSDGKTLDLSFTNQTDRDQLSVSVSFETTIDGVFVPENGQGKASFFNQGEFVNSGKTQTVKASVAVSSDRPFAEKNGKQINNTTIQWTVLANQSFSTLKNFKIVDDLGSDLIYVVNSLSFYKAVMDGEGNLTKGDKITDMSLSGFSNPVRDPLDGNSKLVLQFANEIKEAFYIEYQTIVLVGNGDAVTNTLNVSEEGITTIQTVEKEEVIVKTTTSSGSGTSRRGYLVISKFGEINKEKLAGVSFSLYRKTVVNGKPVETLMRSGTTNALGTLQFNQLRSGTYILKENNPEDGMLIDGNYAIGKQELAGIEVVINNLKENHSDNETRVEVMNYLPTVRVTKKGNGLSLVGTVLELYEANHLGEVTNNTPVDTITMNETHVGGVVEFSQGIKLNQHYVVKEKTAAPGYIRYTGSLLVEPIAHGSHPEATAKIELTNYQGSATFRKVNAQGSGIQGAIFYVYNAATDLRVDEVLINTQSNGTVSISNLKPGTYYVQEHEAPQNYVKNPEKSNVFVIEDTTDSLVAPQAVKVTWKDNKETLINYQGSVKLNKVNKDNQPLQGARFTLYREKIGGTVVGTYTTNSQGELLINNLGSGSYVLVETKAAPGYLVNNTPFSFIIANETSVALDTIDLGTLTNYQLVIGFSKIDQFNQPLQGAKFEVIQRNGSPLNSSIKYSIVYDEHDSSKFTITGLPVGSYRLKETETPTGYIENTELYFDVTEQMMSVIANSEDHVLTSVEAGIPIPIELKNYKAGLSISKFGEKNAILKDVVFTLYDADTEGNPKPSTGRQLELQGDYYTLKDTDLLSPGTYVLEETKGSEGYIRNTRMELITIANSYTGPYLVSKSYTNYKGAVRVKKTDALGNVLSNAEFTVSKKSDGSLVATVTTGNDGFATVTGLTPNETYVLKETKAPQHHIINPTTYEFTIPTESNYSYTSQPINFEYTHVNYQGSVTLKKTNLSGVELQGAKFSLYEVAADGNRTLLNQNIESQADGRITIDKLGTGNYVLMETKAPTGYVLNTNEITFSITSSASGAVPVIDLGTFANYKGTIQFNKVDSDNNLLAGAEFIVLNELSQQVDAVFTEDNGKWTVSNLPVGKLYLVETKAPEGYILNTKSVEFTIVDNYQGKPEVVIIDDVINYQGQVELLKVDQENQPLQGATFKVVDSEGNVVQTNLVSDVNGKVTISHLAPGNYRIIETASVNGHIVNTTPIDFVIVDAFEGPVPTLLLDTSHINYKGTIQFNKVDSDNNLLAGAEFIVLNELSQQVDAVFTEDNGKWTVSNLPVGKLYLVETKAPEGYILNTKSVEFTIVDNYQGKPEVVIIDDVINYQGRFTLTKQDEANKPLKNVKFELTKPDQTTSIHQTDENGILELAGLAPGNYTLKEVETVAGHILNTEIIEFTIASTSYNQEDVHTKTFINYYGRVEFKKTDASGAILSGAKFSIFDLNMKLVELDVVENQGVYTIENLPVGEYQLVETSAPEGFIKNLNTVKIVVEEQAQGQPETIVLEDFINYQGQVELLKVDQENQPLQGATFKVVDSEGNVVQTNLVSNDEGKVVISELSPGNYRIIEISSTNGHIVNTTPIDFEIVDEFVGPVPTLVLDTSHINYKATIQFNKVDRDNNLLAGAEFMVLNEQSQQIDAVFVEDNGKWTVSNLPVGKLTLVETKAPQGYILNTKVVEFEIVDNYQGKPEVLILEDVINYQGRFTLNKHDEANNPLENVKFELTKPDQTTSIHQTDENGILELAGLAPGNYTLNEVETVAGHILNTEIIEFTIASTSNNQEDVHTKTFINYYGRVELLKVNHHNRPLSNVVFDLYNELGEKVYSDLTSDQDGKIVVEHLEVGKYFFKEVASVEGHIINTQPIEFEIAAEYAGKPALVVTDKAVNYLGSVRLLKVDSATKKPLATAEFDLVSALDGQVIAHVVTNQQGIVLVDDLPVGDYYFIETKAPKGYVLDENPVKFTIHSETLGQPDTIELTVSNSIEEVSNLPDTGSTMYPFDTLSIMFIVSGLLLLVLSMKRKEETE